MKTAIAILTILTCCSCSTVIVSDKSSSDKEDLLQIQAMWKDYGKVKEGYISLTDEQRRELIVEADEDGHLVWTFDAEIVQCHSLPNESCQFVMMPDGRLLVARDWTPLTFEHGSIAAEQDVVVAGMVRTENGYVKYINDFSAQYEVGHDCKPLNKALSKLRELKVDMSEARVRHYADPCGN